MTKADWYLREWLARPNQGGSGESGEFIQYDLVKRLGWANEKANLVWHGKQRFNRDMLNQVAELVGAKPFELLMPPERAFALREFEASAERVATARKAAG